MIAFAMLPAAQKMVEKVGEWARKNRELAKSGAEKFAALLTKGMEFLLKNADRLVDTFNNMISLVGSLSKVIFELSEAVGGLDKVIKAAAVAWGTYRIAALAATTGIALGPVGILTTALLGLAFAFGEVETNADRAKKARDRFGAGAQEDVPINKADVERDTRSVVRSMQAGEDLTSFTRRSLERSSSTHFDIVFRSAKARLKAGVRTGAQMMELARRHNITGKSGFTSGGSKIPNVSGRGQLELLEEVKLRAIAARRNEEERRGEDPNAITTLDEFGVIPDPDGGRRFRPFKEPTDAKKEKDSLSDLIAAAIKSGTLPESAALLASSQPPIIIPITNNTFDVNVDMPVNFEGVNGEGQASLLERFEEMLDDGLNKVFRTTIDQISPRMAR